MCFGKLKSTFRDFWTVRFILNVKIVVIRLFNYCERYSKKKNSGIYRYSHNVREYEHETPGKEMSVLSVIDF